LCLGVAITSSLCACAATYHGPTATEPAGHTREVNVAHPDGWTVHIEFDTSGRISDADDRVGDLLDQLTDHGACISGGRDLPGIGVTMSIYPAELTAAEALAEAVHVIEAKAKQVGVPVTAVKHAEVSTSAEFDRRWDL
jgi:hypothetical protein